jgi:hypothetical protein
MEISGNHMTNKAWNIPFRELLETIYVIPEVKTIDPDTKQEVFKLGIAQLYKGTVLQTSSIKDWSPSSELISATIQVRIFEPLEALGANSKLLINGEEYILDGTPVVSSQPSQRRKKMTKIYAHKTGEQHEYSFYS